MKIQSCPIKSYKTSKCYKRVFQTKEKEDKGNIPQYPDLEGTHKHHQVQLLALLRTTQKKNKQGAKRGYQHFFDVYFLFSLPMHRD